MDFLNPTKLISDLDHGLITDTELINAYNREHRIQSQNKGNKKFMNSYRKFVMLMKERDPRNRK
jgi:hypothetical protein